MATRHQSREAVVGLLYAHDIGNKEIDNFASDILEEKKIRNRQKEFALNLYTNTISNIETIDSKINNYLKEWKVDEIGNIERAILRLGAYELLFTDTDSAVIINEAIELSKELASDTSPKFINAVLDSLKKEKSS